MFSKRTEPPAIATQLVVFFTIAAALLLSCGLSVFYWMMVRHAVSEDDTVLRDKIAAVAGEVAGAGGLAAVADQLRSAPSEEPAIMWTRIVDPAGNIVGETPGMKRLLPATVFPAPSKSPLSGSAIRNYRSQRHAFSLVSGVAETQGQLYTIQVGQDRSEDEEFRRQFGALFAVVLAAGILAAALIAITVTRRGLQPLARMKRSLERVGPTHLNERIQSSPWPPELQPMAAAFDNMLSRLENSFLRLSQFSADLAHELRTPLGNILGEAQVALTRARSSDEYRAVVESAAVECERLSGIVDNLLFLARAEAAEREVHRSEFDARAAAEKIASYYETLAEDQGVKIVCHGQGKIFADQILLDRALNNVVDNALRFTPIGGQIDISVSPRDSGTEIRVSDTGSGISDEHLPRVFDRFYRADKSRSSSGTGLGLALVKSIVELHGGSARIESKVGSGTSIILAFPSEASR